MKALVNDLINDNYSRNVEIIDYVFVDQTHLMVVSQTSHEQISAIYVLDDDNELQLVNSLSFSVAISEYAKLERINKHNIRMVDPEGNYVVFYVDNSYNIIILNHANYHAW